MDKDPDIHSCQYREVFALKDGDFVAEGCGWLEEGVRTSWPGSSLLSCLYSWTLPSRIFSHLGRVLGSSPKDNVVSWGFFWPWTLPCPCPVHASTGPIPVLTSRAPHLASGQDPGSLRMSVLPCWHCLWALGQLQNRIWHAAVRTTV